MGIVRTAVIVGAAGALLAVTASQARPRMIRRRVPRQPVFQMLDQPVASPLGAARQAQPSSLRGSRIAALAHGSLVIDGDSGKLLLVDNKGKRLDAMMIHHDAAQLVVDRKRNRAYISDRLGDHIVVVRPGPRRLKRLAMFPTHTEPFGLALTPDGRTLLVTAVADRRVSALDTSTGVELWSIPVGAEPRGIAISPDGRRALVTFLSESGVTRLSLKADRSKPVVHFNALSAATNPRAPNRFNRVKNPSDPSVGRKFVRNAFAATYLGNGLALIAHQISTPHKNTRFENRGTYGGGGRFDMPVEHRITFLRETPELPAAIHTSQAILPVHQPRALVYDGKRDTLYVAGFGSDSVLGLRNASRPNISQRFVAFVRGAKNAGCGPSGLDVRDDGSVLVYCELGRQVATLTLRSLTPTVGYGPELAHTRFTAAQLRGRKIFRQGGNRRLSGNGAMACASCHPEGRNDGLSWRIQGRSLQTPMLTGRLVGTHPFKWDGGDKDLQTSLRQTVRRLGGFGITPQQAKDLSAYLRTLPRPRAPHITNKAAVRRGKRLFFSNKARCSHCHSGPSYTNGKSYDLANNMKKVDTPSLIGLAHSAPYYHDGSAATLRAVLLENGTIHGMGRLHNLSKRDINDLIAFLKTL